MRAEAQPLDSLKNLRGQRKMILHRANGIGRTFLATRWDGHRFKERLGVGYRSNLSATFDVEPSTGREFFCLTQGGFGGRGRPSIVSVGSFEALARCEANFHLEKLKHDFALLST
jgi:hypothetical protein